MKIALLGATGYVGTALLAEAEHRNHHVTALARHVPVDRPAGPNTVFRQVDAADEAAFTAAITGHDVLIQATKFLESDVERILRTVRAARVPRLLVVGGAGSLEVAPGAALVDQPGFPAEYKAEALAGRLYLQRLRVEAGVNWTFLSPSADLFPGERTGRFRLGRDLLLADGTGQSRISVQDFAVAMIDEAEQPRHARQRFTAGY